MQYETLLFTQEDSVGIVTLNRPKQLNSINYQMMDELQALIDKIKGDVGVRSVIMTGGEKLFCVGADITAIQNISTPHEGYEFVRKIQILFNNIEKMDKPFIAAINGYALGGGLELAMACDIRLASPPTKLGLPEIELGAFPSAGGTQRLPRLVGIGKAKEMIYTGKPIDAEEAYRIGLVNKVVPQENLLQEAKNMASEIGNKPRNAFRKIKALINYGPSMDLNSAIEYEAQCFSGACATQDFKEGISAFLEKRKPVFKDT